MADQITPPPASASSASPKVEETKDESTGKKKYLKFTGTKKVSPTHKAGSHYLITQTQLVEGGVSRDRCFKDNNNEVKVTEIMFSPENDHKVPLEAFYKEAADRLLQEPDITLVEE